MSSPAARISRDPAPTDAPLASHARYLRAVLIARIDEILPLIGPESGSEKRLIACVRAADPVQRILMHIDEPITPRSPPLRDAFDRDQTPGYDPEQGEPAPEFEFDQTVTW